MIKPDFESAVVMTTFIDDSLPVTLRKLADYIEEHPEVKDYDNDMVIKISCSRETDRWYTSVLTDYWTDKKAVSMIKKKYVRGK